MQVGDIAVWVGLTEVSKWLEGNDLLDILGVSLSEVEGLLWSGEQWFHREHQFTWPQWIALRFFAAPDVVSAYMIPVVDKWTKHFSWGVLTWELADSKALIAHCGSLVLYSISMTNPKQNPQWDGYTTGLDGGRVCELP